MKKMNFEKLEIFTDIAKTNRSGVVVYTGQQWAISHNNK